MNPDGLPIARLFGIEVRVSITWAVLIAIVTLVGAEQAALTAPDLAAPFQWVIGGLVAFSFLLSVLAHELAHELVGRRRGVESAVIVLGFVGGQAPLAIQARRPVDEFAIAVAGPALSIVIGTVLVGAGAALGSADPGIAAIAGSLIVAGGLNLLLGLLSLLPGIPLDGGRIVRALAWARTRDPDRATRITGRIGRYIGWTTVGVGIAIAFVDRPVEGLLIVSLGWLLATGARTLERRLGMEVLLRGVSVREAMERDVPHVAPNLTLDTFADRYEGPDGATSLPVIADDRVLGVVGLNRMRKIGRRRFAVTRAGDVMASPPQTPFLDPGEMLWPALETLQRSGGEGLAVAEDGRFEGMLTRRGIAVLIRDRIAAGGSAAG